MLQFHGKEIGLLSEAGYPSVADPGSIVVKIAHEHNMKVLPMVGPSSIMLALAASGLNGQGFTFHGYLPIKEKDRKNSIKSLQRELLKIGYTQIFMETPFRNNQLLKDVCSSCRNDLLLSIASEITLPNQFIKTLTIGEWKSTKVDLHKKPTIFCLGN